MKTVKELGVLAKSASRVLAYAPAMQKNRALSAAADMLVQNAKEIIKANQIDLQKGRENGLSESMLDRLMLNTGRIGKIAEAVREVAKFADPVGEILEGSVRPNGLRIQKTRVPLGVIGIIYESRPNVTADAAALCLKTGNAVILRGGKEAIHSNIAITNSIRQAVSEAGLPVDSVSLIEDTSRESSTELMRLNGYVDVLIPRGGAGLIRAVVENSTVPVIETGVGNCHVYVDAEADIDMAAEIIYNAKTSRPSVCNAIETILVHKDIAKQALIRINERLSEKNVELRGCPFTCAILKNAVPATEADYATEFLDYILAVKVVDSIHEAIEHIAKYGSGHSECIVTKSYENSEKFLKEVDAAAVYVNASTRFTDGGEFGLGCEIGISTQKLHARGPMGINELTSVKYVIYGSGQVR